MYLDHALVSQRYFFPRGEAGPDTTWVPCAAGRLACRSHRPRPGAPTLVHFHGNGETVSDYVGLEELFAGWGLNSFFVEYRGYGGSDGVPQLVAMLDDTRAVFEALAEPQEQLVVFGRSVGSIYALEFARRYPKIRGLILESGIADPLQRILLRASPEELGTTHDVLEAEARRHLDHREKLAAYKSPLLVMHTEHDHLVEVDHAEDAFEWAGSAKKELVIFPRGDHNSIFAANQEAYLASLAEFLAEHSPD